MNDPPRPTHVHASRGHVGAHVRGIDAIHEHHVGVAGDIEAALAEPLGKPRGPFVVMLQPLDVVFERVQTSRRENAALPHPATEHLAPAPRFGDEVRAAAEHGAGRCAKALGEADRHRVAMPCQHRGVYSQRHGGVEQAGAVHVQTQAVAVGQGADVGQVAGRDGFAALRVLDADEVRLGEVVVGRLDRGLDGSQGQRAIRLEGQRLRLNAAEHCRAAALETVGVRLLAGDVLVAAPAVRQQRRKVGLGAAGHEQASLETKLPRTLAFKPVDRRIFAVDVVAHLGAGHRGAHRRRGLGDGVRTQVDGQRGPRVGFARRAAPMPRRPRTPS